jgi:ABC-type bacteriocin/lantibiotic exporter with double-glycine peptidase domain
VSDTSDTSETSTPVDISYNVSLVPQETDMGCWAAGMSMLLAYGGISKTQWEIASECGLDQGMYDGVSSGEFESAAAQMGLRLEGGACGGPDLLASWLGQWGPILVVDALNPGYHAVVIAGLRGDGTQEGTYVLEHNPLPVGSGQSHEETYDEFQREYELGADFSVYFVHL